MANKTPIQRPITTLPLSYLITCL